MSDVVLILRVVGLSVGYNGFVVVCDIDFVV